MGADSRRGCVSWPRAPTTTEIFVLLALNAILLLSLVVRRSAEAPPLHSDRHPLQLPPAGQSVHSPPGPADKGQGRSAQELQPQPPQPPAGRPPQDPAASAAASLKVQLLTSAPAQVRRERAIDMLAALSANLDHDQVEAVHLLVDGWQPLAQNDMLPPWLRPLRHRSKLHVDFLPKPPTYQELFEHAQLVLPRDALLLVAHSDIQLAPQSLTCLPAEDFRPGRQPPIVYALTRHPHPQCPAASGGGARPDLPQNLCLERWQRDRSQWVNSADGFLVRLPLPAGLTAQLNHAPNRRGAENRLVHFFTKAGYEVRNPCHAVRLFHRHCAPRQSNDTSALSQARVDTGGASASIPRTPLQCSVWDGIR